MFGVSSDDTAQIGLSVIVLFLVIIGCFFTYDYYNRILDMEYYYYVSSKSDEVFTVEYTKIILPDTNVEFKDCYYTCEKLGSRVSFFNVEENSLERACYCAKKIKGERSNFTLYRAP